jgi:radical SAM protein with 4Fe4S-binding SPASM domain
VNARQTPKSGGGIAISSPYRWRYFLKRIFYHKPLFGPAIDHAIIRAVADACVRRLQHDPGRLFSWVEIETINRCNSTCSFCPVNRRADPRPLVTMSDALYTRIIDDLGSLGYAGKLALHSNNEPLLDEHIVERVRYARSRCPEAYIFLYTNGTRLDTALAWRLIEAGIDLIRIDNYSDRLKLHRNLRRLVEDFQHPRYAEQAARIRIVIRRLNEVLSNRGGTAPNKTPQQVHAWRYYQSASCRYPFDQLVIRPDGKISLCGNDPYGQVTLGDAARQSLAEIWHGEDYRRLRTELTANGRRNLPVCNTCDVHTFDPEVFLRHSAVLRALGRVFRFSSWNWK